MNESLDLKVLQALPYAIFTMFISIMFSMASLIVKILTSGSISDSTLYQMDSNVYMICYFIMYVSVVLLMTFLYEMSNLSKWFNYACTTTVLFILSETADFVARWGVKYLGRKTLEMGIVIVTEIIPSLCIVFLIMFILQGTIDLYNMMDKEKRAQKCRQFRKFCLIAFALQMILSGLASNSSKESEFFVLFIVAAAIIYLYNLIIIFLLYGSLKQFCYDLYMFSYNTGR